MRIEALNRKKGAETDRPLRQIRQWLRSNRYEIVKGKAILAKARARLEILSRVLEGGVGAHPCRVERTEAKRPKYKILVCGFLAIALRVNAISVPTPCQLKTALLLQRYAPGGI